MLSLVVHGLKDGEFVKVMGKRNVKQVAMQKVGGFALGGEWLTMTPTLNAYVAHPPSPDLVMVGVTIYQNGSGGLKIPVDKAAFVLSCHDAATANSIHYIADGREVRINGNFSSGIVRGRLRFTPDSSAIEYAKIIPSPHEGLTKDPYYWAAAYILGNGNGVVDKGNFEFGKGKSGYISPSPNDDEIIQVAEQVPTKVPFIKETVKHKIENLDIKGFVRDENGKKIDLPKGYQSIAQASGIYLLMFTDENGKEAMGFMDILIGAKEPLSDKLIEFINKQANQLEALSQSYRIISIAKDTEKRPKNKRKFTH